MKTKIVVRLAVSFAAVLVIFSVLLGTVFMLLFRAYSLDVFKGDLEKRALSVAATLSESDTSDTATHGRGNRGGYGAYLRALEELAMSDAWVVDENRQLVTSGNTANRAYRYADLPIEADRLIQSVFEGQTIISQDFSNLLKTPTITVGTPIYNNGTVAAALLLHTPLEGVEAMTTRGMRLVLYSMLAALLVAVGLSVAVSVWFTKPLSKIRATALKLAEGEYRVKTDVRREDELGDLARAMDVLSHRLDEASRESERLDRLRREFTANVSHELRTPVTVLRGSLEALNDRVVTDPEQVQEYYTQMLKESVILQRLVDDLLDLSRLQNADFPMELQTVNLCDLVEDAVRSVSRIAEKKGVQVQTRLPEAPYAFQGDYGRLRQMLMILLDNAVKFSPEGALVQVQLEDGVLRVRDNGRGIDPDELPYIFDRFYKAKSADNSVGTGLGLAIAKQIADRHSIRISASSSLGEGSVFELVFSHSMAAEKETHA